MGGALAIALDRVGYRVDTVVYRGDRFVAGLRGSLSATTQLQQERDLISVDSQILIIASADPEIYGIAELVASFENRPKIALHTSGSLSSDELLPLAERGVHTGSLHPLSAVSDPLTGPERFRGAYFCVEGGPLAAKAAKSIAEDIGGKPFSIPTESKALYHAAAVMAAGHVVALLDAAIELMNRCGLSPEEAQRVLLPLTSGSLANLVEQKPSAALTGPYVRGDASALARHLKAFSSAGVGADLREIYLILAARSVNMLIREGRELETLRDRILIAKREAE